MSYPKKLKCKGCSKTEIVYGNLGKIEFRKSHEYHISVHGLEVIDI